MQVKNQHIPVLLEEIKNYTEKYLFSKKKLTVFDGTFGGGGYSSYFLEKGHRVFACDLDADALKLGDGLSNQYPQKLTLTNKNYLSYITDFKNKNFDIIVLDLGFSSNQLNFSKRGFSYQKDSQKLDLRYDKNDEDLEPAYKWIQKISLAEVLAKILFQNSGEPLSTIIANNIFKEKQNLVTVEDFKKIIIKSIPFRKLKNKNAILSRIWQAMRIYTNSELEVLKKFLPIAIDKLKKFGLLMIVSFHSLEDKIVTNYMRDIANPEADVYGVKDYSFKLLTKKVVIPSTEEVLQNPRSRSAMLRVLQKIKDKPDHILV